MSENAPENVLGFVLFQGGHALATLHSGGDWSANVDGVDRPALASLIAARFSQEYRGPQDGHYAPCLLDALARATGGTAWYEPPPPGVLGDADGPSPPQPDRPEGGEPGPKPETFAADLIERSTD